MVIKKIRAITAVSEQSSSSNAEAVEELLTALRNVILEESKSGAYISTVEITDRTYNALFPNDVVLQYSPKC